MTSPTRTRSIEDFGEKLPPAMKAFDCPYLPIIVKILTVVCARRDEVPSIKKE